MGVALQTQAAVAGLSDDEVVERVRAGETALFEILMRRYNQRLYRVARSILGNDAEAEDVMQDAYVRAYMHLDQFGHRARFSTWLTKIAVYEALARRRRSSRLEPLDFTFESDEDSMTPPAATAPDPERQAFHQEVSQLLEAAIEALPDDYRSVFVLREVEGMSTSETGQCLGLTEETVKVRLHRARAFLRQDLFARTGATTASAFQFHLSRCDRVVAGVFARILPPRNPAESVLQ